MALAELSRIWLDLVEFSGMWWNIVENGKLPWIAVDCGNLVVGLQLLSQWKQVDVCKVLRRCPVTKDNIILHDQLIGVSDNSQITNEIGLTWLSLFYKHIKDYTISTYRLLMLNGYNSHINPEFDQFSLDYNIIIIYMLAYLLYRLQPLDIGCFLALKQLYRRLVKQIISRSINYINKREFLLLYKQARQIALY